MDKRLAMISFAFSNKSVYYWLCCLLTVIIVRSAHTKECRSQLGMEFSKIPDHRITASSSYEIKSVGPQNARIRQEKNGGAWCPKAQISSEVREYLEIDLDEDHLVTWTETQGRWGNGQGQEFTEAFTVEYWRKSIGRWMEYKDSKECRVLPGNVNTYLSVNQELELPFVASRIRFVPFSTHPRTVCMRVEIYGCPWEQSVVNYVAPRADTEFEDISYDGDMARSLMTGGLGMLTDSLYGADDFLQFDLQFHKPLSKRWVGWSNDSIGNKLDLVFEFNGFRMFKEVKIHSSHIPTRDVKVFSMALIYVSLDGDKWQEWPIKFSTKSEAIKDTAVNITINLKSRVGRYIKICLYFSARWILISEVSFESELVAANITEGLLSQFYTQKETGYELRQSGDTTQTRKEVTTGPSPGNSTQTYVGLVTGSLAMTVLLVAGVAVGLALKRGRQKVALLQFKQATLGAPKQQSINMKHLKNGSKAAVGSSSLYGRSGTMLSGGIGIGIGGGRGVGGVGGHVGHESEDSDNSSVYHEPYKRLPSGKNHDYAPTTFLFKKDVSALTTSKSSEYTDFTSVGSFGQDDVKYSSPSMYTLNPPPPPSTRPPPLLQQQSEQLNKSLPANLHNYYAAIDIIKTERKEQHFTPGVFTCMKLPEDKQDECSQTSLYEISRNRLRVIEKLGEGNFGMIHLCETDGIPEYNATSTFHKRQVIVKSLRRGCGEQNKQDVMRETKCLYTVRDPNLARIVGVCSPDEPLCIIQEYCEYGDLPSFLKVQTTESTEAQPTINYGCLLYFATQIASGMKHLEGKGIVHRDLAARNCLVGKNYSLKISDHALYCSQYDSDYYVSDTKSRLPIRWMSWESLLLGKYTSKSDVWSFAVTLWEILMFCSHQPLAELTNEQVVENANHMYLANGKHRYAEPPPSCPREMYEIMAECWKRGDSDRPKFSEIHLFLQRKNLGYIPVI
ncbi:discoidin domain-containing receptor 2-like [Rhopalosiphum padi]|uniref:discoidin domain-containing receptor 2-like n=1 Tax=Rhopalosiphum padi TaxID=40932 RepID=UPI00298DB6DE|nr:discoidin domain-containing receptor 2-like [Rhopalosiphum padi]XP_060837375.1 discoidin domain-containing receptor 2-like [Rhopalosiphum padi]